MERLIDAFDTLISMQMDIPVCELTLLNHRVTDTHTKLVSLKESGNPRFYAVVDLLSPLSMLSNYCEVYTVNTRAHTLTHTYTYVQQSSRWRAYSLVEQMLGYTYTRA